MAAPQPARGTLRAALHPDWLARALAEVRAGAQSVQWPGASYDVEGMTPPPRRAPPFGGHFVSAPQSQLPRTSRTSQAFGGVPALDPYAEADLRQQQSEFARINNRDDWFAIPALAPVAAVLGLEGLGGLVGDLAGQWLHDHPFDFPKRGPPLKYRGDSREAQIGRRADADFNARTDQKPGWKSQLTIQNEKGVFRPDISAPARDPLHPKTRMQLELKPNTPSGRRAAARAVKRYTEGTGNKTRAIFYDPEDYE